MPRVKCPNPLCKDGTFHHPFGNLRTPHTTCKGTGFIEGVNFQIRECQSSFSTHLGKWYVETLDKKGNPMPDVDCPHFEDLVDAEDFILLQS